VGVLSKQIDGGTGLVKNWVEPFGVAFINLLKMIAIPLIIASLIKGVSDMSDMSKLSKIGGRTLGIYVFTTMLATSIGLVLVNLINPGKGVSPETRDALMSKVQTDGSAMTKISSGIEAAAKQESTSPLQILVDIVPENITRSMTDNTQMLQVIFFVILLGTGLVLCRPQENPKVQVVKDFFDGLNDIVLKMIDIIMLFAPFGVFALLCTQVAKAPNTEIFIALGWYAATVLIGLVAVLGVDVLLVWIFTGRSPLFFMKGVLPAQIVAFSSSSSAATMPVTMECTVDNLGVDKEVASFVIPVGATVNMDGTALYQAVATVFIAQVFGHDLNLTAQLTIVLTATLASIGSAAVPGAGMLMLVVILQSVGLDPAGIALIFAIDRPLDMCRTIANITGDMSVAMVVSKSMGNLKAVNSEVGE
jgi:proton glutamate symport protein